MSSKTAVPYVPTTAPFTAQQRAWLNGYFAGLTSFADTGTAATAPAPAAAAKKPLLILYGSQTGSAEGLAKKLAKESSAHGLEARLLEANACGLDVLAQTERLLFVTSTWGEGDAPDNAEAGEAFLLRARAGRQELRGLLRRGEKIRRRIREARREAGSRARGLRFGL
jgi:sulfite reductase (NADPH) flavoprotein alpha-component